MPWIIGLLIEIVYMEEVPTIITITFIVHWELVSGNNMEYRTKTYIAGDWTGDQDAISKLY